MPCLLAIIAAMFPRLTLFGMWLTGYGGRAFDTAIWPVLGFFFMPFTTCGYAIAMNGFGGLKGMGLALVIIGVLFDMGSYGGGGYSSRARYTRVRIDR